MRASGGIFNIALEGMMLTGAFVASVLFGIADSLGFRFQGLGMPSQFTGMVPYVVTLISLIIIEAHQRRVILSSSL